MFAGNTLAVAERAFRLLITGPAPPAVNGKTIGHGLPPRPIDLGELKELLSALRRPMTSRTLRGRS